MRIISRKILRDFWELHSATEKPLRAWYADAKQSRWESPEQIKSKYRNASIIANNRVVFNVKGNRYRLIVAINYDYQIVYIRFVGTHAEYDKVNAATI